MSRYGLQPERIDQMESTMRWDDEEWTLDQLQSLRSYYRQCQQGWAEGGPMWEGYAASINEIDALIANVLDLAY